jgi:EAL domain-containing protein (putative c-di-GMP-specific phosphodiesterase class I)
MRDDHQSSHDLIAAGMTAVNNAKKEGRNTYCFFHADMQKRVAEKKRVQMLLNTAADNNEFKMVYQPILSLTDERIQSCEALIRWTPPNSDPIRPDIFIPIAEESGQINKIGSWVLSEVSNQVKLWESTLGIHPTIAINVSTRQLRNSEFREQFQIVTESNNIPAHVVELELTETGMMVDPETCLEELTRLRELGVSISIDDFGTGYSSLDYLRRLPLDILKIDMSFTSGIGVSSKDEEMVRVIIHMAHAMGLKVVCEGVETGEQLDFLQLHGCDLVQGYYFCRPRSVEEITELFIKENNGTINIMGGEAA